MLTAQSPGRKLPPNLFPVKPVAAGLSIARGQHFSYALPAGWHVGEDGQFALTLIAPDSKALTVMVGNSGLPVNFPPDQFVREKLAVLGPQSLQLSQPKQATPAAGFKYAYQFDVSYISQRGVPCRGVAKCSIAPAYGSAVIAMTAAFADSSQWPGYSTWLPLMADQISATDGAAFGQRGIMAQNLQNSQAYAQAAREYREWSQKNWQQVTDQRTASQDKNNFHVRENLGSVQTYANPYNASSPLELPMTYQYYWIDRQGEILGSNDPSANPNAGSTGDWKMMQRHKP